MLYVLLYGVLWLIFRIKYDRPVWPSVGWLRSRVPAWQAILGGCLLSLVRRSPRCRIANSAHSFALRQISANPLLDRVVRFLCGICRALRRGGNLPRLHSTSSLADLGVAAGILVTAAVFGLLHGPEYSGTWQYVVLIAFAGACFGWVRFRGRSVIPAALMHAGFNAVFFFAAVAQTSIQK